MNRGMMYSELGLGVCYVKFTKKNGDIRHMLCTRNIRIAGRVTRYMKGGLEGIDRRNEKAKTDVLGVIDLELGEIRNITLDRVEEFKAYPEVVDYLTFSEVLEEFEQIKGQDKKEENQELTLSDLDAGMSIGSIDIAQL